MTTRQPPYPFHKSPEQGKKPLGFAIVPKIINGGIAGIVGTLIMFPLDLAKTRIQNQVIGPNGEKLYNSLTDCLRKTVKAEGVGGLYRGCLVTTLLIGPEKAIKLTANDFFRYHLQSPDKPLHPSLEVIAGALAGLCQNIVTTPMDLIKIQKQDTGRLSSSNKVIQHLSTREIVVKQFSKKGLLGMYQGSTSTILRNVFFSVVYFPVFFHLNAIGPRKSSNPKEASPYWSFFSGCAAGAIGAAAATPFDVVKTRMQRLRLGKGEIKYAGVTDAFIKICKYEGPSALMKGSAIRMISIAPLFGVFQVVYLLGVGEMICG